METSTYLRVRFSTLCLTALLALPSWVQAAPPDLTAAGVIATLKADPSSTPVYGETYNLGATGLRGWIYIGGGSSADGTFTGSSRQILVTVASTPGGAVLAVDDVILGAMAGSSGTVPLFTSDCRKAFGVAIGDAETTGGGTLRVKRWRSGTTTDENIAMPVMGNYSATAPYSCPKSSVILANARNKMVSQLLADSNFLSNNWAGGISGLALLAGVAPGDPNFATVQTRLQTYARTLAATTPSTSGLYIWDWGYIGLFLSEYYLSTNDAQVVTGLNNYTVALAKVQSRYGTYNHTGALLKADGSLHGTCPPYGPVNAAGIAANMAIVMGKKALLAAGQSIDPEIDPAIQRGSDFFAWYVNKGPIPYGEHEPYMDNHSSNGKDAACAVLFGLQAGRTVETEYYTRMTTASFNAREDGHTGQGFNYLWGGMGANMGGSLAVAKYLEQVRWHLDLERRTDGSFVYDGVEGHGGGSTSGNTYLGVSSYYGMNSTAPYLLTYALPLQRLYITGKNAIPANTLDPTKVTNAISSATFKQDCPGFTTTQLIASLSEFDPCVRNYCAIELAKRSLSAAELTSLRSMVTGPNANGRMGACQALGILKDATALPIITQRLDKNIETDSWVRAKAASAIRGYTPAAASAHRDSMLTAYTANATDPEVIVWDDPVQISNNYLSFALFGDAVHYGNNIASYTINAPKNLLYPAVKAGLKQPDSYSRFGAAQFCYNYLTLPDVQALTLDIFEVITTKSQADPMWNFNPQLSGINLLVKHKCAEGLPMALSMMDVQEGWGWASTNYLPPSMDAMVTYGDSARWTLPFLNDDIIALQEDLNPIDYAPILPKLLTTIAAIENATTSPSPINYLLPLATPQVVTTTGAKAITLTGTSPRSAVTFTNVTAPAHGILTGIPPNVTYTPTGGYTGPDHFTFQAVDSMITSEPGTVSIIVGTAGTGLKAEYYDNADFTNLKLTRTDAMVNFDWGTGSPNALLGADTFSVRWSGLLLVPETGSYRFSTFNSDGVRLYVNGVPVIDQFANQVLNWNDSTSINLTEGQMIEIQMDYYENTGSAVAKLKWIGPSLAGVNGAFIGSQWLFDGTGMSLTPYAHAQAVTLVQNTPQAIALTGSGAPLTYTVLTQPANGTLTGTAPNLTYTPAVNYNGSDSFTFRVNNGTNNSAPATVSIGIWAGQPVDFFWAAAMSGNWSGATSWTNAALTTIVPDSAGQVAYRMSINKSGTYTSTHDLNAGFLFNQLNLAGTVTLAGTNSLAFAANGTQLPQFNQNSSSAVAVSIPLSLTAATSFGGTNGGLVAITGRISGAGALIKDGVGELLLYSTTANNYSGGTVVNNGILHLGAIIDGLSPLFTNPMGSGSVILNNGTIDLERVSASNPLTLNGGTLYSSNGWGATWSGSITLNATPTLDSTWNLTCSGTISGAGGFIKTGGNSLTLYGTNTFTGPKSVRTGTLSCTKAAALGSGSLSISNGAKVACNFTGTKSINSLTLSGTPMAAGTYGSTASPATNKNDTYFSGTGTVTAGAPNNAPVASAQSVSTAEDTAKPLTLTATDANGNPLMYVITTPPAHGSLSGTTPNVNYTPALHYTGADSFTFKANDGSIDSAPATVSITVTAVNDAPLAIAQTVNALQNIAKPITLTGVDVEGSALTYSIVTQPANGLLSGTPPNLNYTANSSGTDSFTFKVSDGTSDSALATVTISVIEPQTLFTGASSTDWNTAGNWDAGLPTGSVNMIMGAGKTANNASATPATSTGKLTLNSGSIITIPNNAAAGELNMVTTPSSIEFNGGMLDLSSGDAPSFPPLTLTGTGRFTCSNSTGDTKTRTLNNAISGSGQLTIEGRNRQIWNIGANNPLFLGGMTLAAVDRYEVRFNAAGSAGTGNVTVTPRTSGTPRSAVVVLGASNVFADTATLTLNGRGNNDGSGWTYTGDTAIDMKSFNDTIGKLIVLGVTMPSGLYTGGAGTWITGSGTLTVTSGITPPPTLASSSMVDNKGGGSVVANTLVTYTLTFSKDMNASTVSAADFGNAGASPIIIGTVTETAPGVFTVPVTPTSPGTLRLKVNAGAVLNDVDGNALVTTSTIEDDTIINVISSDPATFAGWQAQTWPGVNDPNIIGLAKDPDQDGLNNLLEWALHLDAIIPSVFRPTLAKAATELQYTYTRRKAAPGAAVFQVEWSDTLGNDWSNVGVMSDPPVSLSASEESVIVRLPESSTGKRFIHLKVSTP